MKKRANPDSETNIRRIDTKPRASKQTHGFQVHFLRGDETVTRMFSDAICGGKEAARRAARKFRRAVFGDLPERAKRGAPLAGQKKTGRVSSAKSKGPRSPKRNSSRQR